MSRVEYLRKPKLRNPCLIAGLPGIANVGKLAAEFLLRQLRAKKFIELQSEHLPEWAIPERGGVRPMKLEFYYAKPQPDRHLILLSADAQASTPDGQYILTGEILDIAQEFEVSLVGTMAAYVLAPDEKRKRPVVGVATDRNLARKLEQSGVELLNGGVIVGMNGILPALASLRGIDGFCLLGTTSGGVLDPRASANVLGALSNLLEISIDVSELLAESPQGLPVLPETSSEERPTYIG
jgi:hypothetical protein